MKKYLLILLSILIASPFSYVTGFAAKEPLKTLDTPVLSMNEAGLMVEAEDLTLSNGFGIIEEESASGGKAVSPGPDTMVNQFPDVKVNPSFSLKFNCQKEGDYIVFFRMRSINQSTYATCYLEVDKPGKNWYNPPIKVGEYIWSAVTGLRLKEGFHAINYYYRGTMVIDKIIITSNPCDPPVGMGELPKKFDLANQSDPKENLIYPLPPVVPKNEHPRLLVTKEDLPKVKENLNNPQNIITYKKLLEQSKGNYNCNLNPANYTDNSDLEALSYIEANAFLYLIDNNIPAGYKAVKGIKDYLSTLKVAGFGAADRHGLLAVYNAGIVYDWCHDLLTKEDKEIIIEKSLAVASKGEFGWPPVYLNAYNNDHGDEYGLMKNLFAFSIAVYDDYQKPYNMVAGRLFKEYITSRNIKYVDNIYNNQGDDYGRFRAGAGWFFRLLLKGLGADNLISENQHFEAYQQIYRRLPNGYVPCDSDMYSHPTGYSTYPAALFLGSIFFNDPYLKGEYYRNLGSDGPGSMEDSGITNAMYLILNNVNLEPKQRDGLPLSIYSGNALGIMTARTSWDEGLNSNAMVASFKMPERFFGGHSHRDGGHFYIYNKGPLAIDSGIYESAPFVDQAGNKVTNVTAGSVHNKNYARNTIAHNAMLIYDPNEKWLNGGRPIANGGGQSATWETPGSLKAETENTWVGKHIATDMGGENLNAPDYTYLSGDLTKAYNNKAKEYTRSFMFFNFFDDVYPGALIVFDRVNSANPNFKKTYLLHSEKEPEVKDNKTIVKYDTFGYNGKLINTTLLPKKDDLSIEKVGGKGKEFLIGDWNYYSIPTSKYAAEKGHWRTEISPKNPKNLDYFLNVIETTNAKNNEELKVTPIETNDFAGAVIKDRVALFSKENKRHQDNITFDLKGEEKNYKVAVADIKEGSFDIYLNDKLIDTKYVTKEGTVLYFDTAPGKITIKRSRKYITPYEKDLSILGRIDNTKPTKYTQVRFNDKFYTSLKPIKEEGTYYLPVSDLLKLFDERGKVNVTENKIESDIYGDAADKYRTVITKDSDIIKVAKGVNGEFKDEKISHNIISRNNKLYISCPDLLKAYDVKYSYNELGDVIMLKSTYTFVDNSLYIINKDKDKRAEIADCYSVGFLKESPPYQAFDDNMASQFAVNGKDTFLDITLKEPTDITGVSINFAQHGKRTVKLAIDVSYDGKTYEEMFNGESKIIEDDPDFFETFKVEAKQVKKVKLRMFGNSINGWNTICEMYINK